MAHRLSMLLASSPFAASFAVVPSIPQPHGVSQIPSMEIWKKGRVTLTCDPKTPEEVSQLIEIINLLINVLVHF